ncbi:MAG: ribosomal-protein-alanine N-acetyltransferase [Chlamydiales bacterium]|jgi:ribosomal-protein-alanine N-acetyltransferase|nr:ribosomal-protein-alanine N-acetyltransferase [Chlamydiales bacterium]
MQTMRQLETARMKLIEMTTEQSPALYEFESENKAHFALWRSNMDNNLIDYLEIEQVLKNWQAEHEKGDALRLGLYLNQDPQKIIGLCNFTHIVRGAFQSCYLGYRIGKGYEGKSLMYEALQAAIPYIFNTLNLHRIMANYMPTNQRSGKLLRRLGFKVEGYAQDYLFINGKWEDHILTSITNPAYRA